MSRRGGYGYLPKAGEFGKEEEDDMVQAFVLWGLRVAEQTDVNCSKYSSYDILVEGCRLQVQRRTNYLERFQSIYVPDHSLDYDWYVVRSSSGAFFSCSVEVIHSTPLTEVNYEMTHDVPIGRFQRHANRFEFVKWLAKIYNLPGA